MFMFYEVYRGMLVKLIEHGYMFLGNALSLEERQLQGLNIILAELNINIYFLFSVAKQHEMW